MRAWTAARSVVVAVLSGVSGHNRALSVRSVSARTNATNRSSLLPADPYRDRRFLTWFRARHHHREPDGEQGVDDLAVRAFDRHLPRAGPPQPAHQLGQTSIGVAELPILRHEPLLNLDILATRTAHSWLSGRGSRIAHRSALEALSPVDGLRDPGRRRPRSSQGGTSSVKRKQAVTGGPHIDDGLPDDTDTAQAGQ